MHSPSQTPMSGYALSSDLARDRTALYSRVTDLGLEMRVLPAVS